MVKRVAVITKCRTRHHEALRTALGLLLERHLVTMIVLDHEIACDDHDLDNLGFLDEMGGHRYSNHPVNVECHGFRPLSSDETAPLLSQHDLVIPF